MEEHIKTLSSEKKRSHENAVAWRLANQNFREEVIFHSLHSSPQTALTDYSCTESAA